MKSHLAIFLNSILAEGHVGQNVQSHSRWMLTCMLPLLVVYKHVPNMCVRRPYAVLKMHNPVKYLKDSTTHLLAHTNHCCLMNH